MHKKLHKEKSANSNIIHCNSSYDVNFLFSIRIICLPLMVRKTIIQPRNQYTLYKCVYICIHESGFVIEFKHFKVNCIIKLATRTI